MLITYFFSNADIYSLRKNYKFYFNIHSIKNKKYSGMGVEYTGFFFLILLNKPSVIASITNTKIGGGLRVCLARDIITYITCFRLIYTFF